MKKLTLNFQSKNRRLKNIPTIIIGSIIFLVSSVPAIADPPTNPDSSSKIIEAIDKVREEIVPLLQAANTRMNELFSNAYSNLTGNAQQPNLATQNPANAYKFAIKEGTDTEEQRPLPIYDLVKDSTQKAALKKLQASILPTDTQAQRQILLQPPSNDKNAVANMLDAQSLLGPLSYTPTMQNSAERLIEFLSDYANPLSTIDLQKLRDEKPELDKSQSAQDYKVKVYTQGAIRSLLLGNLYDSLQQRVPVANLATLSGMPKHTTNPDASLAEVLKHIASRRISDPKWYETMDTATPIAVQREMVFLLSEMQWQLYQLHVDNERMLQTLTAVGVLNLRAGSALPDKNASELEIAIKGQMPTQSMESDTKHDLPPSTSSDDNGQSLPRVPQ